MQNLALLRPATQSSTCNWSTDPDPAVDAAVAVSGDLHSPAFFHTGQDLYPWWQVDLGEPTLIRRVEIDNRPDMAGRLRNFSLLRSLDGKSWSVFHTRSASKPFQRYTAEIEGDRLARFVRVRLNGAGVLHFRQCRVFGDKLDRQQLDRLAEADAAASEARARLPEGRKGDLVEFDGLTIFIDNANYAPEIRRQLRSGTYERRERMLALQFLTGGDRVLEVGTAIGIVAMTAARMVGPENVATFDANPDILADAEANFRRNDLGIKARCGVLVNRRSFTPGSTLPFYVDNAFWASRLIAPADPAAVVKTLDIPTFCLEDEIARGAANVLICDIEGGEVDLLGEADLTGVRLILMETHYGFVGEAPTDAMLRKLINDGFSIQVGASGDGVLALRR